MKYSNNIIIINIFYNYNINNENVPIIKYKLCKNPIGKGAFSTVYYATDVHMQEYAIKRIIISKLEQSRLSKFLLELDISVKINHENIVKCYEIFKTSIHWYIVSEYCNYGTFVDLITILHIFLFQTPILPKAYIITM